MKEPELPQVKWAKKTFGGLPALSKVRWNSLLNITVLPSARTNGPCDVPDSAPCSSGGTWSLNLPS